MVRFFFSSGRTPASQLVMAAAFFKKACDTACTPAVAVSTISCIAILFLIFYLQSSGSIDDNSFSFNVSYIR